MPELERIVCTYCGATMQIESGSKSARCKYCNSEYHFKEEKGPALILALNNAAGYLTRHDFDSAIVHYESVLKEYPNDSEAAWGHAISTYGIVYEKDDRTEQMIPTCSRIVKESILQNSSYLSAIRNCAEKQRAIYEENAAFIDRVQKKIKRAMEDEEDFDVFISFKAKDENGIVTEDSVIARNIYDELKKRGIKPFFSEVTLKNRFGDEFEPIIYRALYSCKFFILVSTKEEYIEAPWVKNEWTRFRDRVMDEGLSGACAAVYKNISAYALPRLFQSQGIELEKHPFDYAQLIADNLSVKLGLNSREKELEEKQRKMEEELQRLRAENERFAQNQSQPAAGGIDKDALMSMLREIEASRAPANKPESIPAQSGEYDVVLMNAYVSKLETIKAVREITGMGLKEAKDIVEAAPRLVKTVSGLDEANRIADAIRASGAEVEIRGKNKQAAAPQPVSSSTSKYDVIFCGYSCTKLNAVNAVKNAAGLGLKEAKDIVEAAPRLIKTANGLDEANRIANLIRNVGAEVIVKASDSNSPAFQPSNLANVSVKTEDSKSSDDIYYRSALDSYNRRNYTSAVESFRKAAENGHSDAQNYLGYCYANGQGVSKDYEKAVEWYRMAANQGNASAQYNLGACYSNGNGVLTDSKVAFEWYQKSAAQGNASAQYNLGNCYKNGNGVPQDYEKAIEWYKKSASKGNEKAQKALVEVENLLAKSTYNEAVTFYNTRNYYVAFDLFNKSANAGIPEAKCYLGRCYENGFGVDQDYNKAILWYDKAAKDGHVPAYVDLGRCYENGIGVSPDSAKAEDWYKRAAILGDENGKKALSDFEAKRKAEDSKRKEEEVKRKAEEARKRAAEEQRKAAEREAQKKLDEKRMLEESSARDMTINNGVLVKYNGNSQVVAIPKTVTSIGREAFLNCGSITAIHIPDSIKSIGKDAFNECRGIKDVYITDLAKWCAVKLEGFNSNPMYYSKSFRLNGELITDLVIPDGVKSIGDHAFNYCDSLKTVVIPRGARSIGTFAFDRCQNLISIEIPDTVTTIESYAFDSCHSLKSIVIPRGVKSIGTWQFYRCKSLTSVVIPSTVTEIGNRAFSGCVSLTSIEIPGSVKELGSNVFDECTNLKITVDSVEQISNWDKKWNPSNCKVFDKNGRQIKKNLFGVYK